MWGRCMKRDLLSGAAGPRVAVTAHAGRRRRRAAQLGDRDQSETRKTPSEHRTDVTNTERTLAAVAGVLVAIGVIAFVVGGAHAGIALLVQGLAAAGTACAGMDPDDDE